MLRYWMLLLPLIEEYKKSAAHQMHIYYTSICTVRLFSELCVTLQEVQSHRARFIAGANKIKLLI